MGYAREYTSYVVHHTMRSGPRGARHSTARHGRTDGYGDCDASWSRPPRSLARRGGGARGVHGVRRGRRFVRCAGAGEWVRPWGVRESAADGARAVAREWELRHVGLPGSGLQGRSHRRVHVLRGRRRRPVLRGPRMVRRFSLRRGMRIAGKSTGTARESKTPTTSLRKCAAWPANPSRS